MGKNYLTNDEILDATQKLCDFLTKTRGERVGRRQLAEECGVSYWDIANLSRLKGSNMELFRAIAIAHPELYDIAGLEMPENIELLKEIKELKNEQAETKRLLMEFLANR